MGTPDFAVGPLRRLVESGYNIVAVVTMPDKPAGRGLKVHESAVKQYAASVGLPVLQPEKLKDPAFVEQFKALDTDLGIVIAFRMLPGVFWSAPRLGTFNLPASLLPDYRGAAPINWAVINGDTVSGVTTFMLNHEIDKGDILGQVAVPIAADDNAGTLHDKLMEAGTGLVVETVGKIASGNAEPLPQPQTEGAYKPAPKIFRETCRIDWSQPGASVVNLIRGLSPYPGAWSELRDTTGAAAPPIGVKIFSARFEQGSSLAPGMIATDGRKEVRVGCLDGHILLGELQLAGKKRMWADDLLRGFGRIGQYRFE